MSCVEPLYVHDLLKEITKTLTNSEAAVLYQPIVRKHDEDMVENGRSGLLNVELGLLYVSFSVVFV